MKPKKCANADAYGKNVQPSTTLNRRAAFCRFVVFSACVSTGVFALIGADDAPGLIICEGAHEGHLQGVDSQGTNIWWSFTRKIVRTDLSGRILASCFAPSHQGDLCVKGDTLYVAVNHGRFNRETMGDGFVYSYDAMTLEQKKKWKLDMPMGAGAMTWKDDRFYVVGGLTRTSKCNYVYEYDAEFNLIKRHELNSGYPVAGIQTAEFVNGEFLFGIYGGKGNPRGVLRCSSDFRKILRYKGAGSTGLVYINGKMYTGYTPRTRKDKRKWYGHLYRSDKLLDDENLLNCPWYRKGVVIDRPLNAAKIEIGTAAGGVNFGFDDSWRNRMKELSEKGHNAVFIDLADGYQYPRCSELAAKGAWSEKELLEALEIAREEGIEPIPYMDFTSSRNSWLGGENHPSVSKKSLVFCCNLIKDIGQVFSQPRYFKIETDGLSEKVVTALNAAILSYSCPWSVTTCSKTEK